MTDNGVRYVRVGKVSDVPPGGAEVFEVEEQQIAVYRLEDGWYAIDDICTHDGGPLAQGEVEGDQVICPRHGARFSIKTGAALTFPAITPVGTYSVRVEGDDLFVGIPD